MAGLDASILVGLDESLAVGRIRKDQRTDFIHAPQYNLIYEQISGELWQRLKDDLGAGRYAPSPLITADVPKPSGLTRPGAILYPMDRLLYQGLADYVAPKVDAEIDSTRVFSYRLLNPDDEFNMFESRGGSYERFKSALATATASTGNEVALVTDVSSYFTHINHHTLENLFTSAGVPQGLVRLLVSVMLQNWSGRFSSGIPQGMFPSDLLGNYYLCTFDTHLASAGITSYRYVDD